MLMRITYAAGKPGIAVSDEANESTMLPIAYTTDRYRIVL